MIGIVLWNLRWPLITTAWAVVVIMLMVMWRRQTRMFQEVQRTASMAEPVLGRLLTLLPRSAIWPASDADGERGDY